MFIHNIITIKTKVLLPQAYVTLAEFGDPSIFGLIAPKTSLNYLAFQPFDFEGT